MAQAPVEYRYSDAARKRAAVWLAISVVFLCSMIALLVLRWFALSIAARIIGSGLVILLLLTIRAQSARFALRCLLWPDRVQIVAPLANRMIVWNDVIEVRRVKLVQASGQRRWACVVMARTPRGSAQPIYLFDDQLERAEDALHEIVARTPQAEHVNIGSSAAYDQ